MLATWNGNWMLMHMNSLTGCVVRGDDSPLACSLARSIPAQHTQHNIYIYYIWRCRLVRLAMCVDRSIEIYRNYCIKRRCCDELIAFYLTYLVLSSYYFGIPATERYQTVSTSVKVVSFVIRSRSYSVDRNGFSLRQNYAIERYVICKWLDRNVSFIKGLTAFENIYVLGRTYLFSTHRFDDKSLIDFRNVPWLPSHSPG